MPWAEGLDSPCLRGFSQRFATPLSDAPTDNYGREMAQSLMPSQGHEIRIG